jgi:putative two-component system response regulator
MRVDDASVKQARILIVDDQPANIAVLERLLDVSDFTNVVSTTDSSQVVSICAQDEPDIVLLDLQMPPPDGFEVMRMLEPWTRGSTRLPILVLTADTNPETKRRALSLGANDFLSKPFDLSEVVLRVRNLLLTRLLQQELRDQNRLLEQRVRERTRDLEEARLEIIERLALAGEYRDDATGEHTQRVGRVSALIAAELGLDEETVELIRRAAPLHDVGKLGISDMILLKPGKLTPVEFEVMKLHVSIGSEVLGRSRSRLLQLSEEIARTHHERWDGSGYPAGLKGETIPLSGRIVAVADVFDAIIHKRPYKDASPPEQALAEITNLSGVHFDPQVVEAFTSLGLDVLVPRRAKTFELVA